MAISAIENGRKAKVVPKHNDKAPSKYTYALKAWSIERRADGWYVAPTMPSFTGNKTEWRGPFATIESACLSIARGLAVEVADRHTRSVEAHKISRGDPLYGFKPDTRLKSRGASIA